MSDTYFANILRGVKAKQLAFWATKCFISLLFCLFTLLFHLFFLTPLLYLFSCRFNPDSWSGKNFP